MCTAANLEAYRAIPITSRDRIQASTNDFIER